MHRGDEFRPDINTVRETGYLAEERSAARLEHVLGAAVRIDALLPGIWLCNTALVNADRLTMHRSPGTDGRSQGDVRLLVRDRRHAARLGLGRLIAVPEAGKPVRRPDAGRSTLSA